MWTTNGMSVMVMSVDRDWWTDSSQIDDGKYGADSAGYDREMMMTMTR